MFYISGFQKLTLLDYPGETACTVFTPGCDLRCPFCHNSELVYANSQEKHTPQEIIDYLKKRQGMITGICITGGEPAIQTDLHDFLWKVRNSTDVKIKLDTNGVHPVKLIHYVEEGLIDYVAMDVKAGIKNYRKLIGVESLDGNKLVKDNISFNYIRNIRKSIEFLLKGTVDYEFRTTVVGGLHTEEDFYSIRDLIKGAKKYYLQAYKDSGDILLKDNDFYTPSKETMENYRDIVKDYVDEIGIRGID